MNAPARLTLHAVDRAEAQRIVARAPRPGDRWASDYPFDGDLAALWAFLRATEQRGEQPPFGYHRIEADGTTIGGIGFKGAPEAGAVEVGYGLVPSARGHGRAAEALGLLLDIAAEAGVTIVRADTEPDNVASQRTLERCGFTRVGADGEFCYERRVD